METTQELLKDGGRAGAETSKQTLSSVGFTSCQASTIVLYTCDMSEAPIIQQMDPPMENTPQVTSYSHPYLSQMRPSLSSSISTTPNAVLVGAASASLMSKTVKTVSLKSTHSASSSNAVGKPRDVLLPLFPPQRRRPRPYPCNLTLKLSSRRPHCLARDRLRCWLLITLRGAADAEPNIAGSSSGLSSFSREDHQRIVDVMSHAWEEDTREVYGSGLLVFHVYCNGKNIQEHERAPASQLLLLGFVSSLAASYAGKTIANYFYGV